MKKRHHGSDSLELLLDTVCSMFGAILLIAILVALMAQTGKQESPVDQASAEMLQRRISVAEEDLAKVRGLLEQTPPTPLRASLPLAEEQRRLEAAVAQARRDRDAGTSPKDSVSDYSTAEEKLIAQVRALDRKVHQVENELRADDQELARLQGRTRDVGRMIQNEKGARSVSLRFPKERVQTKSPFRIICKFNRVYPLRLKSGGRNETSIRWESKGNDSTASIPIEQEGWTTAADSARIESLLRALPKSEYYIVIYAYPDSFETFRAVREQATRMGLECGFELQPPEVTIIWSAKGSADPPPL